MSSQDNNETENQSAYDLYRPPGAGKEVNELPQDFEDPSNRDGIYNMYRPRKEPSEDPLSVAVRTYNTNNPGPESTSSMTNDEVSQDPPRKRVPLIIKWKHKSSLSTIESESSSETEGNDTKDPALKKLVTKVMNINRLVPNSEALIENTTDATKTTETGDAIRTRDTGIEKPN